MTNKEWLSTLTTEECYDVLHWLFTVYTYGVNNSKKALIQWLDSTDSQWRRGMKREETVEVLSEIRSNYNCFDKNEQEEYHALSMAIEALKDQKTGEWIESEQRDRTICSVCGYWQDLKAKFLFSFCPNCGSLMRGGYTNENISDS